MNTLSHHAAKKLRHGKLPHIPPRAAPLGTTVTLQLESSPNSDPFVILTDVRRNLTWRVALALTGHALWACDILLPNTPTVLTYRFVQANGAIIREQRQFEGVIGQPFGIWHDKDFRIAVYDPSSLPPTWTRGAVMYQIFPDRFAKSAMPPLPPNNESVYGNPAISLNWDDAPEIPPRSRDFYGGDLRGILQKLSYLADLGITCIYLTPIFASPTNHRYDALDYMQVDPRLGTSDDLNQLITHAKAHGIHVILDGVFNHCSSESIYFKHAKADKQSIWHRCFEFETWQSVYMPQPLPDAPWAHKMEYPRWQHYTGWAGVRSMPEWVECPEMEHFFLGTGGVVEHWMQSGIMGWRTDVTPWMSDDFWRKLRRTARAINPDTYIIAEDWGDCTPRFLGDTFDAAMNYRFANSAICFARGDITPSELDDRLETIRRDYGEPFFQAQMNLLGSHDTARTLKVLARDKTKFKLAVALQLGYAGIPVVYYGDEVGCDGNLGDMSGEAGRVSFPWGNEDTDLQTYFRAAIHARRNSRALSLGDIEAAIIDDAQRVYGFWRMYVDADQSARVLVLLNASNTPRTVALDYGPPQQLLFGSAHIDFATSQITLAAHNAVWISF